MAKRFNFMPLERMPIFNQENPAMNPATEAPKTGNYSIADFVLPKKGNPDETYYAPSPQSSYKNIGGGDEYRPGPLVQGWQALDNSPSIVYAPQTEANSGPKPKPKDYLGPPVREPGPPPKIVGDDTLPIGPPAIEPVIPPPATLPPVGNDLRAIGELYGRLFPGGGTGNIPAPTEQGPVLLYPVNYQRAESRKSGPNPLIFLILAGVGMGGFFLYKRFSKG